MLLYTLRQLEYAVAIADAGSVAGAAGRLRVAQPSLSAALMKLEDQLGLQIFIRHHAQGVTPTSAGQRFLAAARSLLAQAQDFQREAESAGTDVAGQLTLGCFITFAPVFIPKLFAGFRKLYPRAELMLKEGIQDDLIAGLRAGRFDLALLYRLDMPEELAVTDLATMEPYALFPASHPLARKRKVSLRQLAQEPLILLDIAPSRTYFLRLFDQHGITPRVSASSPSLELVRGMVGQGLGYSLLITRPYGDHTYDGESLAIRPIAEATELGVISLARLKASRPTRLVSTFAQYCEKFFSRPSSDSP
ncbi:MAG: LysR family transcriptional regulator [Hyphomicrobiales bacterium]